jgi:hypothetical protein
MERASAITLHLKLARAGIPTDQYPEKGLFQRLMERLRGITVGPGAFLPVLAIPLEC